MKKVLFHLSAGVSALLPLLIALIAADSPIHVRNSRFWIRIGGDIAIDVPDGSGFRRVIGCPGFLIFAVCAPLPLWWVNDKWRQWDREDRAKNRWKRILLGGLSISWALSVILLLLPSDFHEAFTYSVLLLAAIAWGLSVAAKSFAALPAKWRQERINRGLCANCAYDLRGNTSGVCPECGQPISFRDKQDLHAGKGDVQNGSCHQLN